MRPVFNPSRFLALLLLTVFASLFSVSQEIDSFEGPDHARKRDESFWKLRGVKPGTNTSRLRLNALKDRERRSREFAARGYAAKNYASNLSNAAWTSIGPTAILEGTIPNAGRVDALALDPTNDNIVYAGTAGGGVWKTTDGGQHWAPLTDSQPSLAIGAIAVDPNNPNTIYAGTGEPFPADIATYGVGLLKSTDGGASWTNIQGPFVPSGTGSGMDIAAIAICPQNSNVILVGAPYAAGFLPGGGLYRSADAGNTWTRVQTTAVSSVAFDPNHPGTVVAASASNGNGYLLRSSDSGATWTTTFTLSATTLHTTLVIAPTDSTIYAALGEYYGQVTLKSVDGGNTWKELTETEQTSGGSLCTNQCSYNLVLAVSPKNSQEVYFGAISLRRSQDGGATWFETSVMVHTDQHALVFSPAGDKLYLGDDGGVWSSNNPDADVGTLAFTDLNNGIANLQFYRGISIVPGNSKLVLAGTQDNGTAFYQGNPQWPQILPGDGFQTAIDLNNPQILYATTQLGDIWQSVNDGVFFSIYMNGLTPNNGNFNTLLAMDPKDPQRLYTESAIAGDQLARTVDGSSTWETAYPNLPDGVTSISVSPADDNVVWASTYGPFLVTTNATAVAQPSWRQIALPSTRIVTCIVPDPHDATVAYAVLSGFLSVFPDKVGHVVKLTNTGGTWTNISATFPDIPANDIAIDPAIPNALYVATDVGVFFTADGGLTWNSMGTGLPNSFVTGLALDPQSRILHAGTHGRGIWDLQLPSAPIFSVSPTSVSFGNQSIGTASTPQTIRVTNNSANSMTLQPGVVAGPFQSTDSCGGTLVPGNSCAYSVTFIPASDGAQTGSLTILDSTNGEAQTVLLSGTGTGTSATGFSVSAASGSSTSKTISAGQSATYNLVATAAGGFSGTVAVQCSGAPQATTCSVNPSSFALSSSTNFSVTVTTASRTAAAPASRFGRSPFQGLFAFGMLLGVTCAGAGKGRRWYAIFACLLAITMLGVTSCGSGKSGTASQPQSATGGTPAGTYQLVVKGSSANSSASLNLSLTVN